MCAVVAVTSADGEGGIRPLFIPVCALARHHCSCPVSPVGDADEQQSKVRVTFSKARRLRSCAVLKNCVVMSQPQCLFLSYSECSTYFGGLLERVMKILGRSMACGLLDVKNQPSL